MNRAPLANIVLPIIVGIILSIWMTPSLWSLLLVIVGLLILLIIFTFCRITWIYYIFHYPFWISVGLLLVILHNPLRHDNHYSNYIQQNVPIQATIIEPPQSSKNTVKVVVEVDVILGHSSQGRMMLFVEPSSKADSLTYGDRLSMIVSPKLPSAENNPYQFNYRKYLERQEIFYQAYLSTDRYIVTNTHPRSVRAYAIALRQQFIDNIQKLNLSNSQKGIVEAIFLGWESDLSLSDRQQFRDAGLAHLLCVSGLHVGVVASIIGVLLFFLGRGPRMRILKGFLQLLGVWLFALLTGLAPATTRAAIMFSLFIIGRMFQIQQNSYNTLSASALILLIYNPLLIFDIGFQLSYSAVIGIISLVKPMYHLIPWKDRALLEAELDPYPLQYKLFKMLPIQVSQKLWNLVCLTTAAQLSVLPITLYYFHQFPTYFLIANLTIVPMAGVLLLTIMLSVCFGNWNFIIKLLAGELNIIDSITQWISQLPFASFTQIYFDVPMLIVSIGALLFVIMFLRYRKLWMITFPFIAILMMVVHMRIQQSNFSQQQFWIVYNAGQHTAIEFFEGRKSTLIGDSKVVQNSQMLDYQSENLHTMTMSTRSNMINLDTCKYIRFRTSSIYIVDTINQWNITRAHPTYVILTGNPSLSISKLSQRVAYDTLIFTTNNSHYHLEKWSHECDSLAIPYKNLSIENAFVCVNP